MVNADGAIGASAMRLIAGRFSVRFLGGDGNAQFRQAAAHAVRLPAESTVDCRGGCYRVRSTGRGHGRQGQSIRCRGFERHVNVGVDKRLGLGQGLVQEWMELGGLESSHGRCARGEAVDSAMFGRRGYGCHGGRCRGWSFPKHIGHGGIGRDGHFASELELPHSVFEVLDLVPDRGWRRGRDGRLGAFPVTYLRPRAMIHRGIRKW